MLLGTGLTILLRLGVLLFKINSCTEHQHQTEAALCVYDGSRQKHHYSIITSKHRQNMNVVQATKCQTALLPPNRSDCCLYQLKLWPRPADKTLLRCPVIVTPLPDSIKSRTKLHFLKSSSKSPNTIPSPLSLF